jgi:hypothetical protein
MPTFRRRPAERRLGRAAGSDRWRLVELDTGHSPMLARPREPARLLLDGA